MYVFSIILALSLNVRSVPRPACVQRRAASALPDLVSELRNREPHNTWERNIKIFSLSPSAAVKPYKIPKYTPAAEEADPVLLKAPLAAPDSKASFEFTTELMDDMRPKADEFNEADDSPQPTADDFLVPRSFHALYKKVIQRKGDTRIAMRRLPPLPYCDMCITAPSVRSEYRELKKYVSCRLWDEEGDAKEAVKKKYKWLQYDDEEIDEETRCELPWLAAKYGDKHAALARLAEVRPLFLRREQHLIWAETQRPEVTDCVLSILCAIQSTTQTSP